MKKIDQLIKFVVLLTAACALLTACKKTARTAPFEADENGLLKIFSLDLVGTIPQEELNPEFVGFSAFTADMSLFFNEKTNPEIMEVLGGDAWTLNLSQEGNSLTGTLGNDQHLFYGSGELEEIDGRKWIKFSGNTFSGQFNQMMFLNFNGVLDAEGVLEGEFSGLIGNTPFSGFFNGGNIVFQQQNGQAADCGKLLAEKAFSRQSGLKGKVEIIIKYYEKCVHVCFVTLKRDKKGEIMKKDGDFLVTKLFKPAPIVIPKDTSVTKNGTTIAAFDLPVDGQPVMDDPAKAGEKKVSGEIKVFYATGCKKMHMVQYVRNTFYRKSGDKTTSLGNSKWKQDGTTAVTDENDGQLDGETFFDTPGLPSDYEPSDKDLSDQGFKAGDEFIIKWELETFFVCDGKVLGWYSWGQKITFKIKTVNGKLKAFRQTPNKEKPEWNDMDKASQSSGKADLEKEYKK